MAGLRRRVDEVLQKWRELLEASASLRGEKVELEEELLSWLLELQKTLEDVSNLQAKLASAQSEISSLREQIVGAVQKSWHSSARFACCGVTRRVVTRM